jgi:hypothetical protein
MQLLYKYREITTKKQQTQLRDLLRTESFWFAKATEVNDPFEFRCAVDFGWDLEQTAKAFAMVEMSINPATPHEEALCKVRSVLSRVPSAKLRSRQWELSLSLWRRLADSVTMCCFAGTPDSLLMWSHYAGKHTGVAIEVQPIELAEFTYPVVYTNSLPRISPAALVDMSIAKQEGLFDTLFLRKANCWKYEQEYRILRSGKDLSGIPSHPSAFKSGSIKRLILGMAMPADQRTALVQWVKRYTPKIDVAFALPSMEPAYSLKVASADEAGLY